MNCSGREQQAGLLQQGSYSSARRVWPRQAGQVRWLFSHCLKHWNQRRQSAGPLGAWGPQLSCVTRLGTNSNFTVRVTLLGRLRSLGPSRRRKGECFLFVYIPSSYKMFFKPRANDYLTKQVILLRVCFSLKVRVKVAVVSNSLQPHGLYGLWNIPGQSTGVGSLSRLQGIFPIQDRTQISRIAGFFTSWATREAQEYWNG